MNRRQFLSSMAVSSTLSAFVIPEISYAVETLQLGDTRLRSISDGFIELPVKQVLPDQSEESVSQALSGSVSPTICLLYTSPSPRDGLLSRMPSSA